MSDELEVGGVEESEPVQEPVEDVLDDLGLDLDIPIPPDPAVSSEIEDTFDYDTAFNLAFVGVGQGGSRIAEAFYKLGYRRVAAINTALQDLSAISIPDRNKLNIGGGGAGKDPDVAAAAIADKDEDVYDLLKRSWGRDVDYAIVCLGAGGGTGSGASAKVIQMARQLLEESGKEVRVGVIVALPKNSEGQKPAKNAIHTVRQLAKLRPSPTIIIDNERVREIYNPTPSKEYPVANGSIAKYLHLFDRLAAQDSEHTSFDRADLGRLLDAGVLAFGAQRITEWGDEADLSRAIRVQLGSTLLADIDLRLGRQAGLLFVMGAEVYDTIKTSMLDHAFEMMNRILAEGSTVYRGVYKSTSPGLTALSLVAELPWPRERLLELAKLGGVDKKLLKDFLGV
jgi:cell division GTPase FtsZ